MKKYICILIAVLSLSACRKSGEMSACDTIDYRQALSMYVKRYCSQVILEYYYTLDDPASANAYFGTHDLAQEYAGNARFQALVDKIYAQMDSVSRFDVRAAQKSATCTYKGEWTMASAEWRASGQFTYEVAPARQDYRLWRIETPSFITDVDNFILRRLPASIM